MGEPLELLCAEVGWFSVAVTAYPRQSNLKGRVYFGSSSWWTEGPRPGVHTWGDSWAASALGRKWKVSGHVRRWGRGWHVVQGRLLAQCVQALG